MQTVIEQQRVEDAVAIGVRKPEEMHRGEVHTHEQLDAGGILREEEVAVKWRRRTEGGGTEVVVATVGVVVEVRVEAEKTAQAHEKHEVEISIVGIAAVEPLDAAAHIVEEGGVLLLTAQGMVEELGDEQGNAKLRGVAKKRRERCKQRSIL